MIDNKFFSGFEGEPEILIYYYENNNEKVGFKVWIGYFECLLDACITENIKSGGVIERFINRDGWYEYSTWKIENVRQAIMDFKWFDKKNMECQEKSMIETLPHLQLELIKRWPESLSIFLSFLSPCKARLMR